VAGRLQGCVRATDIVARLGGDEFAIVHDRRDRCDRRPPISPSASTGVLRQFCELEGNRFSMDASIGIAMAPDDGTDADQLLKNADLAMYGAKADGRGDLSLLQGRDGRAYEGAPRHGVRSAARPSCAASSSCITSRWSTFATARSRDAKR
jgi:GGDEF domain-containing protein